MRRAAWTMLAAGSALLLAGCSSGGANPVWADYFQILKRSAAGTFGDHAVTRDQATAIPYASLGYRINGEREQLLVLATDIGGEQLWTSKARVVIVTQDGRIKRTVGFPHDIGQLAPAAGSSLPAPATALLAPSTSTFTADFPDTGKYSIPLICRMAVAGRETITILGQAIVTTRVDENCESPQIGWRFKNRYWLDASRFVWRSLQYVHPKGDSVEIEVFRPPE